MTTQLTLHYTLCTGLLLAVAAALMYIALEGGVMGQDRTFLAHKMQVLALILHRRPVDMAGLEQEVRDEAEVSARSQSPYFLRVLDPSGHLLAETPGMGALVPLAVFPDSSAPGAHRRIWRAGGKTLLLGAMRVPATGSGGGTVQAALDIDSDIGLLRRYRRDVIALVTAGLVLAAALGAWITRRGPAAHWRYHAYHATHWRSASRGAAARRTLAQGARGPRYRIRWHARAAAGGVRAAESVLGRPRP